MLASDLLTSYQSFISSNNNKSNKNYYGLFPVVGLIITVGIENKIDIPLINSRFIM